MDVEKKYNFHFKESLNMKKILPYIYRGILYIIVFEGFIISRLSTAFFPIINEPNHKELKSSSIEIGKTAIQLIQFGQNEEAIKLLDLAIKLNPKEIDLWIILSEAQIKSNKKLEALASINRAIKLNHKEESIYFRKASILMDLNEPKKAKISIKKGLSINNNNERGFLQ